MGESHRRRAISRQVVLEAEEALDLVPAAEHKGDREGDQHEQHDVEAVAGEPALLPLAHARVAAGAVVAVPELDRARIQRDGFFVVTGRDAR